MGLPLFEKLLKDLEAFPQALRVMRMNKIGEPLLNKNLPTMIKLAKDSGRVGYIDLATNASMFSRNCLCASSRPASIASTFHWRA